MRGLGHRVRIDASAEHVFAALADESGLRSWATSKVFYDEEAETWEFHPTGMPATRWVIIERVVPSRVDWRCISGPEEVVGSLVRFTVSDAGDHRTVIDLLHTDWPTDAGQTEEWNTAWGALLHHLKNYAETEIGDPAFG